MPRIYVVRSELECKRCQKVLPRTSFDQKVDKSGQIHGMRPYCRECKAVVHSRAASRSYSLKERFLSRIEKTDYCWLWNGAHTADGYGIITNGEQLNIRTHRLAWEIATGAPIPSGFDVLHTCDIRNCVRYDEIGVYILNGRTFHRRGHLFLGTDAVNTADKIAKGRNRGPHYGERHHNAKISDEQAHEIIDLYAARKFTQKEIGSLYGITATTVLGIVKGRRKRAIDEPSKCHY